MSPLLVAVAAAVGVGEQRRVEESRVEGRGVSGTPPLHPTTTIVTRRCGGCLLASACPPAACRLPLPLTPLYCCYCCLWLYWAFGQRRLLRLPPLVAVWLPVVTYALQLQLVLQVVLALALVPLLAGVAVAGCCERRAKWLPVLQHRRKDAVASGWRRRRDCGAVLQSLAAVDAVQCGGSSNRCRWKTPSCLSGTYFAAPSSPPPPSTPSPPATHAD